MLARNLAIGCFVAAVFAAAAGLNVAGTLGIFAVVGISLAAVGTMTGLDELTTGAGRLAAGALIVGITAQGLGGALAAVLAVPTVQIGLGVVGLFCAAFVGVQLAAGALRNAPPPRHARRARVAARAVIVEPEVPRENRTTPANDDEIGLFGGRRGR